MKYFSYFAAGLAVVALAYFGFSGRGKVKPNNDQVTDLPAMATQTQWETKVDERQPVTIAVTPLDLGAGAGLWKFEVALDTHSGSLDLDPTMIAELLDGRGNAFKPISWEAPGPGGHHREGILTFRPINPSPAILELKFKNVGGIPERIFRWDLKQN